MIIKNETAYKSIGEVAKLLNLVNKKNGKLNTHTIRFWEKEFNQIKPKIFSGKRRYYDNNTIEILKKVKFLLKDKGMTINGAKKQLINENSFDLDELTNSSINTKKINLKSKIKKISDLVKEIKKLG
ncbi:MAG: MerR family transcriptional regulator [Candidatus Pelagibacter bacterium]|jgi:DNA-binding transcriptional MerR regulator|nr:transcriptional regulator [Candidatus Pelagibacter sp.]MDP7541266.1 MerR family transcriptional regulator [Candidatus Pelagibacter bacterium]|tara:strand:+ start:482 stop:862 length:381 start_codon:yes stop_codon:yes gene_type:complete